MGNAVEVEDFRSEVIRLMQELLRIDTTNPPGNETEAAEYLKDLFEKERIDAEILESETGRGSVLAGLEGSNSHPKMIWFSHIDVVPATDVEHWKHAPFSGDLDGEWIYGRGAIDTKCLTAVQAMALILLKRSGIRLKAPIGFGAVADEERGGNLGAKWLVENHPDKVKGEHVINEGGGSPFQRDGKLVYLLETAEKGLCWVKATAHGKPCHASIPDLGESAVSKLSTAISLIASHSPKTKLMPNVKALMAALSEVLQGTGNPELEEIPTDGEIPDSVIDEVAKGEPEWRATLRSLTRMSIAPTMIKGGVKENVVPDYCEGVIDCRLLPGQDLEYALNELNAAIKGRVEVTLSPLQYHLASSSPVETPLFRGIQASMERVLGRSITFTPSMVTGATDSRFLRPQGSTAYGFMPFAPTMSHRLIQSLIHNIDERINIDSLITGTKFFIDIGMNPPS